MRNKVVRIVILILVIIFIISFFYVSNAAGSGQYIIDNFKGEKPNNGIDEVRKVLGVILNIIRVTGAGIAIIMLTILAGKYMMSSAGEKAEIKKHAGTYVIGAIVMISAAGILGIVRDFVINNLR